MPHARMRFLFACAFVLAAVCINFSWIHTKHDADSLLTSLISIERWTPYYWGDNRLGTLLPLLASGVRSYIPNLLFQTQLSVAAALLTAVLFQCFFLDREHGFTVRNLGSACITIVIAILVLRPHDRVIQVFLLPSHPYFTSLSLALAGLIAVIRYRKRPLMRCTISVVALLLSFWVNWTNGPVIVALTLLLPSGAKDVSGHVRARTPALLLVCGTLATMYCFSLQYPRLMITGIAPLSEVPDTISRLVTNMTGDMIYPVRAAILVGVALVAAAVRWRDQFARKLLSLEEAHIIIGIAFAFAVVIASTEWVIKNQYEWRYWTVPVVLIFLVPASFVADSIFLWLLRFEHTNRLSVPRLRQGRGAFSVARASSIEGSVAIAFAVLLFSTAIIRSFRMPSLELAHESIDSISRVHYAKVDQLRCTHMIGDYWVAWSSVFYNRSHDIQPPLWAVSLRSEATEHLWSRTPQNERRYCGVCGDRMNNYYEIVFKLAPLRHTGQAGYLCVFEK